MYRNLLSASSSSHVSGISTGWFANPVISFSTNQPVTTPVVASKEHSDIFILWLLSNHVSVFVSNLFSFVFSIFYPANFFLLILFCFFLLRLWVVSSIVFFFKFTSFVFEGAALRWLPSAQCATDQTQSRVSPCFDFTFFAYGK